MSPYADHACKFDEDDIAVDGASTINNRLCKMCRQIAQTELHSPTASWLSYTKKDGYSATQKTVVSVHSLALALASSSGRAVERSPASNALVATEFFCGFDAFHKQA